MSVRTRLAPSPTGFMHIGTLRTALHTYLFTRQQGGKFLLRIEDTDQKRFVEGAMEAIIEGLAWAGIHPDEGPGIGGDYGPYIQTERKELYQKHVQDLIDADKAYHCFCTSEDLEAMRQEQIAMKKQPMYDRRCRNLSPEEIEQNLSEGKSSVVRFKIPLEGEVTMHDLVRGHLRVACNTLDDLVLMKSDGLPTYHLAMAVDDHLMKITHVTRTEEWLPSLPKHILLYEAFGWEPPKFAHLPLLLNADRSKLSKRKGDVSLTSYINKGYLQPALINFLALLGWNTPDDKEIFTFEELIENFSFERCQKGGAFVDTDKLDWLNAHYIKELSPEKLVDTLLEFWVPRDGFTVENDSITHKELGVTVSREFFTKVAVELQTRLVRLDEFMDLIPFFFQENLSYDPVLLSHEKMKVTLDMIKDFFPKLIETLQTVEESTWNRETLKDHLIPWIQENALKNGQVLWPMRAALTGTDKSPGAFEMADILGKTTTLERMKSALALLS